MSDGGGDVVSLPILPGTGAAAATNWSGTGVPPNGVGVNGDTYTRIDGGALTTIYQKRAGAWVGIV